MTFGLETKTFRWNFIESIEPARVVHVRTTDMMSKDNMYGQVTVRFHSKQVNYILQNTVVPLLYDHTRQRPRIC